MEPDSEEQVLWGMLAHQNPAVLGSFLERPDLITLAPSLHLLRLEAAFAPVKLPDAREETQANFTISES